MAVVVPMAGPEEEDQDSEVVHLLHHIPNSPQPTLTLPHPILPVQSLINNNNKAVQGLDSGRV